MPQYYKAFHVKCVIILCFRIQANISQSWLMEYLWSTWGWVSGELIWWWLAVFSLALRVCSRRGKLSLCYYMGVYLCKPKMRLPMGVRKFSYCFLGSKRLANKLSGLEVFEFTVVRKHSGPAHGSFRVF